MTSGNPIEMQQNAELQYEQAIFQQFQCVKPVEIQLKLVSSNQAVPRNIKSVTLTLSNLEEAWHIFEDLTNLAWDKIVKK